MGYVDSILGYHDYSNEFEFDFDKEITQRVWSLFMDKLQELGYESRIGQENMALDISDAIKANQNIIVEAGVGIGKSYAYLAPLMYYSKLTDNPVVVSTSTISLQEQLKGDIDKLSKIIDIKADVVLAKGMTHFICKDRAIDYMRYDKKINIKYPWLKNWIEDCSNGDRSELPYPIDENIWNKINVSSCQSNYCDYKYKCYYKEKRNLMLFTKGIILCNHDLLAADMQKKKQHKGSLLSKDIKLIVIDEAHNLEDKVRNILKQEYILSDAIKTINEAVYFIEKSYKYDNIENNAIKLLNELYMEIWNQVQKQYLDIKLGGDIERFYINVQEIHNKLILLLKSIDTINTKVQLIDSVKYEYQQNDIIEKLEDIEDFFKNLSNENSNMLFWIELRGKRDTFKHVAVIGCQKDLNKSIRDLFFKSSEFKTILTSATLTNSFKGREEERYSYIIKNLGFPIDETGYLAEPKESDYLYNENALVYYKEDMPHPTKEREKFISKCVDEIVELLFITNGKSLILFTAKSDMLDIYSELLKKDLPWKLLIQQSGSSQESILSEFKLDVNSVLLGTGAFWEGISIEGEPLSNLIIVRLPFPVPDPIIDYKKSLYKNNSVMKVDVPEMLIRLRQGIGRLIRKKSDKGIVAILDPRLSDSYNSQYKDAAWEALPMKVRTNNIDVVKEFVEKKLDIQKIE